MQQMNPTQFPQPGAQPSGQLKQINAINANSRQQFIIEEEGAYSQRSSDEESEKKINGRGSVGTNGNNNFNTNSQLNLSKKPSQSISTNVNPKQQTNAQFTYSGIPQENVQVQGKSLTRNIQNESQNEPGSAPHRDNFNGDTGHDYNIQQQEEFSRRQAALAAAGNSG